MVRRCEGINFKLRTAVVELASTVRESDLGYHGFSDTDKRDEHPRRTTRFGILVQASFGDFLISL